MATELGNHGFTWPTSLLAGGRLTDGQTGYRAFSRRALDRAEIIHDYNYAQVLTLDLSASGCALRSAHRLPRAPNGLTHSSVASNTAGRVIPAIARGAAGILTSRRVSHRRTGGHRANTNVAINGNCVRRSLCAHFHPHEGSQRALSDSPARSPVACPGGGQVGLASEFQVAPIQKEEHLELVRGWVKGPHACARQE